MFDLLEHVIQSGEKLGVDHIEARYDDLQLRTLVKENQKIKETNINRRRGIGITVYYQGVTGYSFSADLDKKSLKNAVKSAFGMAKASADIAKIKIDLISREKPVQEKDLKLSVKKHPAKIDLDYKIALLDRIEKSAIGEADWVKSSRALYGELYGSKFFLNSDGDKISWEPLVVDLRVSITAAGSGGTLVRGVNGRGGSKGLEFFEQKKTTPEVLGENAHKWAKETKEAKSSPAGKFRALCDNRLSGVLAHESFGHCAEADFILTNNSAIAGKIGTRIGSDHVSIYDMGTPDPEKYNGFWLPYDDEGTKTTKTLLVENGILKGYLHNRATAKMLNGSPSGNARAITYRFNPIPRMKNTFFAPGDLTEEEAIEQLGEGIYAIQTSGGQVNPSEGTFLFKAVRGYWIENGEIQNPIKDVTIKGSLLDLLKNVEGVTKDLEIHSGYFGGCGKGGQYPLPCGLGSGKILFSEANFGGEQ
ncbi:MAG: hypothetical protein GF308_17355 [Candidatus Heimdallarchaeota archaeon]|nr:hypothetical protein [Candidatus Heimdallarchaeota archaeon]